MVEGSRSARVRSPSIGTATASGRSSVRCGRERDLRRAIRPRAARLRPGRRRPGDSGTVPLDFTAIDFETANSSNASACAVGLARVRDGIRPARNLKEGGRYIVALRRLKNAGGATLEPKSRSSSVYRDHINTFIPAIEQRRPHLEQLFGELRHADVGRPDLYLAWDFTVASERSLSERVLHIRDDAFASLNGGVPSFKVDRVDRDVSPDILRRVSGTFQVPNYLTGTGAPGSRTTTAPTACPARNGTFTARFLCIIPRAARTKARVGRRLRARAARQSRRGQLVRRLHQPRRHHAVRHRHRRHGQRGRRQRRADPAGQLQVRHAGRPAATGDPQLPVPRPADEGRGAASPAHPPSRSARRPTPRSTPATSPTTATVRAASSVARSPQSRRSGRAPCSVCRA